MAPSPYSFIISIGPVDMNKYAKFDRIPSKTLKDIKETKRYGRTDGRTDGWTDNVKTVYPPTNTVCGGYNKKVSSFKSSENIQKKSMGQTVQFRILNSKFGSPPKFIAMVQQSLNGLCYGANTVQQCSQMLFKMLVLVFSSTARSAKELL